MDGGWWFQTDYAHGATDPFGDASVEDVVNLQDLHAALLASQGLDQTRLTVAYDGRDTSFTDTEVRHARVVDSSLIEILSAGQHVATSRDQRPDTPSLRNWRQRIVLHPDDRRRL